MKGASGSCSGQTSQHLTIGGIRSYALLEPGQVLPIDLALAGRTDGSLKVSLRLIGADGAVVAQRDEVVGPKIESALAAPADLAPGLYSLAAVLYDPNDLTTLPDEAGRELAPLTTIEVAGE